MGNIIGYECRRLLGNKFFVGLLAVTLFYGWQVLQRVTILGISHTAPFSPWSFGDYLSRMVPLLWIGTLFLLTFFTSSKARRVSVLTSAAPISPRRYGLARCAAALTGAALLAGACLLEAALFYGWYFSWYQWSTLWFPALVTLVPPVAFALGSGWVLGRARPWLIYAWMALPLLGAVFPLPRALSIWNGSFFTLYPLALETLDPSFALPLSNALAQWCLLAAGVVLLLQNRERPIRPRHWKGPGPS